MQDTYVNYPGVRSVAYIGPHAKRSLWILDIGYIIQADKLDTIYWIVYTMGSHVKRDRGGGKFAPAVFLITQLQKVNRKLTPTNFKSKNYSFIHSMFNYPPYI